MDRYVLTTDLRDDPAVVAAYRKYHAEAWPEVVASLRNAGVREMDIYLLGRRLVMILELVEGANLADVIARHAASSEKVAEWERMMKGFQQAPPDAGPSDWWARMEPVFHLSGEPASAPSTAAGALHIP